MTVHEGHRKRMRERYRKEGLDSFAPHEVLELLLFYARARGDVNPLAHTLLDTFGSLRGVFEAAPDQLMAVPGVGEETATLVSLIAPMFRRYYACICEEKKYLRTRGDAIEYCKALLAGRRMENFYVLTLNADNELLGCRKLAEGSLSEVPAYPRKIVEVALNQNAHGVVLCHNHPSGKVQPSTDDWTSTFAIRKILDGLDIKLYDHIIVAGDQALSMDQVSNHTFEDFAAPMSIEAGPGDGYVQDSGGRLSVLTSKRKAKK